MNYCKLDSNNKHIEILVDWIFAEVTSAGGDGDFYWYSRNYNVEDIIPYIERYNSKETYKWNIKKYESGYAISRGQEGWNLTNSEDEIDSAPSWIQGKLKY